MRTKRILCAAGTLLFVLWQMNWKTFAKTQTVSAASAVVIQADTGEILFEKDSHTRRSMASTTKIMTAYIALRQGMPDEVITVTGQMLAEGTSVGLKPGDRITMQNLLYGLLLQSGNDAANAIACAVAGSIEGFARLMNEQAKLIGMQDTHFVTPSGLDDKEHYTTAYDMALLAAEAMKLPEFAAICSMQTAKMEFVSPKKKITLHNHNRLLKELPGEIGIKTGFTKKSGRCLVSAVRRDEKTLIIVTLKAPNDWEDHKSLAEYGFSLLTAQKTVPYTLPRLCVTGGERDSVAVCAAAQPVYTEAQEGKVTYKVCMRRFEYAPVKKGDTVGEIRFMRNGKVFSSLLLTAAETVERKTVKKGWLQRLFPGIG